MSLEFGSVAANVLARPLHNARTATLRTISFPDRYNFTIEAGGTWTNLGGAAFRIETRFGNLLGTGAFMNQAGATLSLDSDASTSFTPELRNNGTVEVQTGSLVLTRSGTHRGTFTVAAGATLAFTGGTHAFGGGLVSVRGTFRVDPAATISQAPLQAPRLEVHSGSATFNSGEAVTLTFLTLAGGTLTGSDNLNVGGVNWSAGTLAGTGRVTAPGPLLGVINMSTGGSKVLSRPLVNNGSALLDASSGALTISAGATWTNASGAVFDIRNTLGVVGTGAFVNQAGATLRRSTGPLVAPFQPTLTNAGTVEVLTGTLNLTGGFTNYTAATGTLTGGTYQLTGALRFPNADVRTNAAALYLDGPGSALQDQTGQNGLRNLAVNAAAGVLVQLPGRDIVVSGGFRNDGVYVSVIGNLRVNGNFTNQGVAVVVVAEITATGGYTQAGLGFTYLGYATVIAPLVDVQAGYFSGLGTITGNLRNAGEFHVGGEGQAGTLNVTGTYTQTAAGTLVVELGGLTPDTQHDVLIVNGTATLGGTLRVALLGTYRPTLGDEFAFLSAAGGLAGNFTSFQGLSLGGGLALQAQRGGNGYSLRAVPA